MIFSRSVVGAGGGGAARAPEVDADLRAGLLAGRRAMTELL
jgi:hypothetical protein